MPLMAKLDRAWAHGAVHLVRASLAAALVSGTGACTVLFNPDNIDRDGGVPGSVDAPPGSVDAGPPIDSFRVDAMPGDLTLYSLSPDLVEEGSGTGRAIPVAIEGVYIADDAMVRLTGLGAGEQMLPLTVSDDGTLAAFELVVPVDITRGEAAANELTVTVVQSGQMESLTLNVDWLDELVATVYGASRNFTFDTDTLNAKFSSIRIDANMGSDGEAALRLVATAELVLAGVVTATGLDSTNTTGGLPGPGGCEGGDVTQNGACTPGGGMGAAITTAAGGGGGGHASEGGMGTNTGAAVGGGVSGTEAMTDLADEHGNGGGGGGDAGSGNGGGGGGGGGVIELTSLGTFRIESNGRLSVQGGDGGSCGGGGGNNGGGGGGSGGAILLRSAQPISGGTSGTLMTLDGGQGGATSCGGQGGAGAPGRARVDAVTLPNATVGASPFHGAVLDPATPRIVREAVLPVTVRGGANKTYAVISPGTTTPQAVTLNGSGSGTKNVTLLPGVNRVCVLMTQTDVPGGDDENCLDVAYVP